MANEKRLIWDEDAKRHIIALAVGYHTDALPVDRVVNAILHHTPTVDAVEVVRCKNCAHFEQMKANNLFFCKEYGGSVTENDYCSRAEPLPNCGAKMDGGNEDA